MTPHPPYTCLTPPRDDVCDTLGVMLASVGASRHLAPWPTWTCSTEREGLASAVNMASLAAVGVISSASGRRPALGIGRDCRGADGQPWDPRQATGQRLAWYGHTSRCPSAWRTSRLNQLAAVCASSLRRSL